MRQLILLLLVGVSFCSYAKNKATLFKADTLNGIWIPVKEELGGKTLAPASFEGQKLTILDNTYIFMAESADRGIVTFSKGKMDIYGNQGVTAGKHFTAIYKFADGQLIICYNLAGDSYPSSFETSGNPKLFLCVFKKELLKETIIIKEPKE